MTDPTPNRRRRCEVEVPRIRRSTRQRFNPVPDDEPISDNVQDSSVSLMNSEEVIDSEATRCPPKITLDTQELNAQTTTIDELSPLTPLTPVDAIENSSDPAHNRFDSSLEAFSTKTVKGPPYIQVAADDMKPAKLSTYKSVIKKVSEQIFAHFEGNNTDYLKLVTPEAFYHGLFYPELHRNMCRETNVGNATTAAIYHSLHRLYEDTSKSISQQIYDHALNIARDFQHMKVYLAKADCVRAELKKSEKAGLSCLRRAHWIGLVQIPKIQVTELMGKRVFESAEDMLNCILCGALKEDEVVATDDTWYRICSPPPDQSVTTACIFWRKDSEGDETPTWNKVFGAVVYNIDKLGRIFDDSNKITADDLRAAMISAESTALERTSVNDDGKMTKGLGLHSSYGISYQRHIPELSTKSKNPQSKTLKKLQERKELRVHLTESWPISQAKHWYFLKGFLPQFAKIAFEASQSSKTLNILQTPDYSSFATYAYAAGPHLDFDEAPTSGWVVHRSEKIPKHESNFIWAAYKLILELDDGCFWFWDAAKDEHGTTMNRIAMKHREKHEKYYRVKSARDAAQWTRVLTLPQSVAQSNMRGLD